MMCAEPAGAPGGPNGWAEQCQDWRLPSTELSVRVLRRALRPLLADSGLSDDAGHDLLLATCEAAANAVEHAQRPSEPCVDVRYETADGRVTITVRDHGRWREGPSGEHRGRGLGMMHALADVTLTARPQGTTVVLRSRGWPAPPH
jgi:anti-sigma regulatory factor (Ser/Thr protein kinase)